MIRSTLARGFRHAAASHDGRENIKVANPEPSTETAFPLGLHGWHNGHLYGDNKIYVPFIGRLALL